MIKYVNTMVTFSNPYPESIDSKSENYVAPTTNGLRF